MLSFKEIKQLNRKRSIDMLTLLKGENKGLQVKPRWPSSEVLIENNVFDKLMEAQSRLPPTIQLLLVRGKVKAVILVLSGIYQDGWASSCFVPVTQVVKMK